MVAKVKQIKRVRLKDEIIEQIVSLITQGKLKSGEKLPPEPVLMQQFGVGRSSLREAIGSLSLAGVLTVQPGRGTYVSISPEVFLAKPLSWGIMIQSHKLEELLEARALLETGIVALAAKKASKEDITKLRKNMDELKAISKNNKKRIQADMVFHFTISEISHNKLLSRFISECNRMVRNWMEQIAFIVPSDTVVEQHENIINAITQHDVEQAKLAMQRHIEWASGELVRMLGVRNNTVRKRGLAGKTS